MSTHPNNQIHQVFHKYSTLQLGEGDAIAGANLLAAMACTIANLHPPGSCFFNRQ